MQNPNHPITSAGLIVAPPDLPLGVVVDAVTEVCCVVPPDDEVPTGDLVASTLAVVLDAA